MNIASSQHGLDFARPALLIGTTLVLAFFVPQVASILPYALILWALMGPRHVIEALLLSWILGHLNPGIFLGVQIDVAARWLLILSVFAFALLVKSGPSSKLDKSTIILFFCVAVISSISFLASYNITLSLIKLLIFFAGAFAIITWSNLAGVTEGEKESAEATFDTLFAIILIFSIFFIINPVGYFLNQEGFQGILLHPQVYGVFLSIMLSWSIGRLLSERRSRPMLVLLCIIGIPSLLATQARVGIIALTIGLIVTFLIASIHRRDWLQQLGQKISAGWFVLGFFAITLPLLIFPETIANFGMDFLFKRSDQSGTLADSAYSSRGFLVARSWENFLEHPWIGIGFGLASDPATLVVKTDPIFGLPIGAAVEKGILPVAILEETGIIGAALFIWLIVSLAAPIVRDGTAAQFWMFATCISVNIGESLFISFGGHGLFVWLMIGLARGLARPV